MFKRSTDRVAKLRKPSKRSFREDAAAKLREQLSSATGPLMSVLATRHNGAVVTLSVGPEQRLFAAHEDVLARSPYFAAACKTIFAGTTGRRLALVNEDPEVLSAVLEFLYRGDYTPRLLHDKKRNTWMLEDGCDLPRFSTSHDGPTGSATIYCHKVGQNILRDTAIYCAADRYGLEELKRLALRKQGLQSGLDVPTILRSAQYAYDNTPDTDSRLRAHYLALIIRSGKTFRRSGSLQAAMEAGHTMWFDLFVAMSNHIDDLTSGERSIKGSPRTI